MKSNKSFKRLSLIPVAIGGLFALISSTGIIESLELKVYDLFLGLKPAVREAPNLVLLDVNEESIVRVASWPWPRGLMARAMEGLSEFDAAYAVFDIEYIERSPMSVDREYLTGGLKSEFDGVFDEVGSNVGSLFGALASGNIRMSDAGEYGDMLMQLIQEGKGRLYEKTGKVAVENDSFLGQSMRLFGKAFVTLNMQAQSIETNSPELRKIPEERFAYPKIKAGTPIRTTSVDYLVPIPEISLMAAGGGFTNVRIDNDGIRRRIRLIDEVGGKRYLQLAFSPLVRMLGEPEIMLSKSKVVLKDAALDGKITDVSIPLDPDGYMAIRWPRDNYDESFRHVSIYRLIKYRDDEEMLAATLRGLRDIEAWALVPGANPVEKSIVAWEAAEAARAAALSSGTADDKAAWLQAKASYRSELDTFLSAGWDATMADLMARAKAAAPAAEARLYDEIAGRFAALHGNCAEAARIIEEESAALRSELSGAFCVIGWTATATTDMGANPFEESYVNVGTHAAVANTILQRDFLDFAPSWTASILSVLLSFAVVFLIARLKTVYQLLAGLGMTIFVFASSYALFHFSGIYIATLAPTLSTFLSFTSYAFASFLISEREKSFLRKAFGTYLSGDVINQIIADPTMLKLGGQKKWISAMFTDIKGFSTVSEVLDPENLVKLLNLYLSGMSDIVLENKGTIDKYEGDAIIAFFGAPLSYETHARAACLSAVMMKRKEAELNERFLADKLTPTPLLTRIGVNTGDMVVGNMGTVRKMDYTIMGNAVNLAARLEGVNKQYGSWILASDATKIEAGDDFQSRRFDRVRVVGINTPVQLWEIVDLKADLKDEQLDFLERFEAAHLVFDAMDWKRAAEMFGALSTERPTDGPSATYRRRSEDFLKKAPAANWDGVFSLNEK
ncbi:MAG TPA: adenylate/guanylate cyclase domain-containing protein [Treponema sp.]|nr:MAG: guanylate cyclase [Treponema sp. GWC1_61_84]HCM27501.1 adenylate/guanylate cyclase domain-containing protein [Treponema sp.]